MARKKSEVLDFVVQNIESHPQDIVRFTSEKFGFSRQVVNRYVRELVEQGIVESSGKTRKTYLLKVQEAHFQYDISPDLEEDRVWRNDVAPLLQGIPENVRQICQYGVTEIVNNAIDHSEGKKVIVNIKWSAAEMQFLIVDDGIGIFKKIMDRLNLEDERHAILELAKGKLTTDPQRHTGEGIFFTSRLFDKFYIFSSRLLFSHISGDRDWLIDGSMDVEATEAKARAAIGTMVQMIISTNSDRKIKDVMDQFTVDTDDYGFGKTIIPVALAKYGEENLVSRSQARRLLTRIDRFREVILDFDNVNTIGQAFADEVFRVWRKSNPDVLLIPLNTNQEVSQAILRAYQTN